MENTQEQKTYAQIWDETEPIELPTIPPEPKRYLHGSKGLSKMLVFVQRNNIDNKLIDQFMSLNPREEGDQMRLVSKFQKSLLKYRGEIYKFPNKIKNKLNESTRDK
jgi:hypothetical protein